MGKYAVRAVRGIANAAAWVTDTMERAASDMLADSRQLGVTVLDSLLKGLVWAGKKADGLRRGRMDGQR